MDIKCQKTHIVALRQGNTQMRALRGTKKHIQNPNQKKHTHEGG